MGRICNPVLMPHVPISWAVISRRTLLGHLAPTSSSTLHLTHLRKQTSQSIFRRPRWTRYSQVEKETLKNNVKTATCSLELDERYNFVPLLSNEANHWFIKLSFSNRKYWQCMRRWIKERRQGIFCDGHSKILLYNVNHTFKFPTGHRSN